MTCHHNQYDKLRLQLGIPNGRKGQAFITDILLKCEEADDGCTVWVYLVPIFKNIIIHKGPREIRVTREATVRGSFLQCMLGEMLCE